MAKVTALCMDTITKKSGHSMVPCAVSVCITPAAPSPLPIPYPVTASIAEGVTDPCMRTKFDGADVCTVGSCFKACHGNEPGTLKEVVSLNTGGPCFLVMGAPNVFVARGGAGSPGRPGFLNPPTPVGAAANASGAGGAGGGGGSGSGSSGSSADPAKSQQTSGGAGGGGGGGNAGASASPASGGPTQEDQDKADRLNSPGVTAEDVALARAPNRSDPVDHEQEIARRRVAAGFYRENGQKWDRNATPPGPRSLTHSERVAELACTDYSQPVDIGPPPPISGRPLYQYQTPGNQRGGYFAQDPNTTPNDLGIGDNGKAWNQPGQPVVPKQQSTHQVNNPDQPYLTSTTSPAEDTWSTPGTTQSTTGGGQQTYIPEGSDINSPNFT